MVFTSLDSIVKNILMKRGYSFHWYIDFLVYSKDGLREIGFDESIQTIRRAILAVNQDTHTAEIPIDYQDFVKVCARTDQYLRPLVEDNSLDTIPNYDANFEVQPYADGVQTQTSIEQNSFFPSYNSGMWWTVNWNAFGENLGRQFGGVSTYIDTFKLDLANNQIKINERLACTEIVLEYIGDGMDADSATHINAYCQSAIEAYCMWQFFFHNRTYSQSDSELAYQKYTQERKILRARLSDLTIDKLKRIIQRNTLRVKY